MTRVEACHDIRFECFHFLNMVFTFPFFKYILRARVSMSLCALFGLNRCFSLGFSGTLEFENPRRTKRFPDIQVIEPLAVLSLTLRGIYNPYGDNLRHVFYPMIRIVGKKVYTAYTCKSPGC